ncbi:MAG: hypothetical protein QOF08_583 [Gaiellales bacterium]|jgi:hypothetical protein|nr:hypothetical protein [Gaiellales bacterium]
MSSINQFPYQDYILRHLGAHGTASASQIAAAAAAEGRHSAEGHDTPQLHEAIAANIDHLVQLGLAEYVGSGGERSAQLTASGNEAVSSLP